MNHKGKGTAKDGSGDEGQNAKKGGRYLVTILPVSLVNKKLMHGCRAPLGCKQVRNLLIETFEATVSHGRSGGWRQ